PGNGFTDMPEKYASTGIPILIKQLADMGCTPENLKATIAGGALVGPVSQQDIGLDIGGRSADIAMDIFKRTGIEVIKSETGGFFTCTLNLNMETGSTEIKPAWEIGLTSDDTVESPTETDISRTIDTLKPIPQTALKIMRMFQDNRSGIMDITDELAKDQVLSAQTLKLCNTALFSGTVRVDTLKDAVLLLGKDTLVKTVIAAAVSAYYDQTGTSGYSLCRGGLFFHAVGVATTAEHLAERSGKVVPTQAYTAGLLHDIGKVVLDQYIADSAPLLFRNLGKDGASFIRSERKILGTTHCQAGSILASAWKFSDALTQVIRHHHNPESADSHKSLVDVVYLADLLAEKFATGLELEFMQTRSIAPAMSRLGLSAEDVTAILDTLPLTVLTPNDTANGPHDDK
ncbi:MAG: HDOD domain-containing protein, partial [Desulfobacterales bacterium]|nr:HDOD domain-containing protein [Desulfobacterales bacterium]